MEKGRKRERERERCGSTFAPPLHLHFVIKPRKQITGLPYVLRTYVRFTIFLQACSPLEDAKYLLHVAFPLNTLPISSSSLISREEARSEIRFPEETD